MKVRIVEPPSGTHDGISLESYRQGCVYDVSPTLGAYLVAMGFAIVEMREEGDSRPPRDRRRG